MKMEKKVFGYPEFNAEGEQVLTTYDNEYRDMLMDIRVYRMKAGTTRSFAYDGEETAVLLLSGELTYAWEGQEKTVTRKDVFTEGPWAVHVSSGVEVKVTAVADSEILVQRTKNEKAFAAKLYAPEDAPWKYSAVGKFGNVAKRRVNTIFDHDINTADDSITLRADVARLKRPRPCSRAKYWTHCTSAEERPQHWSPNSRSA